MRGYTAALTRHRSLRDVGGVPAVSRPDARRVGAQRHPQCCWARQLPGTEGDDKQGSPATHEGRRLTPEGCAPSCMPEPRSSLGRVQVMRRQRLSDKTQGLNGPLSVPHATAHQGPRPAPPLGPKPSPSWCPTPPPWPAHDQMPSEAESQEGGGGRWGIRWGGRPAATCNVMKVLPPCHPQAQPRGPLWGPPGQGSRAAVPRPAPCPLAARMDGRVGGTLAPLRSPVQRCP